MQELCETLVTLRAKLAHTQAERKDLVASCNSIEKEMLDKEHDFELDSRICVPLRNELKIKLIDPPLAHSGPLVLGSDYC